MGAVERQVPRVKTSELTHWISKVRVKKRRFKRKNLFIEAVLANALVQAEHLLQAKQQERKEKWKTIKSTTHINAATQRREAAAATEAVSCEEITKSLDDFMFKLSQIKIPVER